MRSYDYGREDLEPAMKPLTLDEYQRRTADTAIYPGKGTALGLIYCALKLNGEAGELAEHLGKAIRDDGYVRGGETVHASVFFGRDLMDGREALILKEVGDNLWYLAQIAEQLGTTLGVIAQGNLDKLADRKNRGVLGGSGDNR